MPVRGRQLADVLRPAAHHPGEVAGVAQAPDHDAVQVHGLDEVAEQRPLQAQHVPPGDLVRAGHGDQLLAQQDAVPRLHRAWAPHWHRPFSGLDLRAQVPPELPGQVLAAGQVGGELVGRVEPRVSAGGRAHVEVEQDVVPQPVAALLQPHEDGALAVLPPLAQVQLQLRVQEVEQRPPGQDLRVAVVDHQPPVVEVFAADALGPRGQRDHLGLPGVQTLGHDDPCQRLVAGVRRRQAHSQLAELLRDQLGHRVGEFLPQRGAAQPSSHTSAPPGPTSPLMGRTPTPAGSRERCSQESRRTWWWSRHSESLPCTCQSRPACNDLLHPEGCCPVSNPCR